MNTGLEPYGFGGYADKAALYSGLRLGRVVSQSKRLYRVVTESGELMAQVSGGYARQATSPSDFPAVGDFVMLECSEGTVFIRNVLERKSVFIRKAAGTSQSNQVVASNIDVVFICMGMDRDFNIRRLERYLSIAWNSGATPVVVLTKSDLCEDAGSKTAQAEESAVGADVIVANGLLEDGADILKPYIHGKTAAFLGSSGVGKSTLINRLAGGELLKTGATGLNGRGRHTTTSRELLAVCGGAVIDTPGMREVGLENADVSSSFSDIDELSAGCRFSDCSHTCEPGCAVQQAIESGTLSEERLNSYLKLKKEAGYDGLNSRQIEEKKMSAMFAGFGGIKNAKKYIREKIKRE